MNRALRELSQVLRKIDRPGSFCAPVVRHEGQERAIDFGGEGSRFQIQYAAFYADCEHEIRPLREGHRLCLTWDALECADRARYHRAERSVRRARERARALLERMRDEAAP